MSKFLICLCLCLPWMAPALAADPAAPGSRTITLVRHGNYVDDPSADKKLGPGLSPIGVAQAHLAGARLAGLPKSFDAWFVSPLQRARDTAALIGQDFPGSQFEVVPDLEECTPPTRRADVMNREKPESLAACKAQLDRLFAAHFTPSPNGDRSELFVCHGNVIRYLVTRALDVDSLAWLGMSVGHASITRIRIDADGTVKVIAVGDVGHIPSNLQTGATGDGDKTLEIPKATPAKAQ